MKEKSINDSNYQELETSLSLTGYWFYIINPTMVSLPRKVFFCHKGTKSLSFTKFIVLINNTLCTSMFSVSLWFSSFLGYRSGLNGKIINKSQPKMTTFAALLENAYFHL